jgi:hypothetical protein
MGLETQVILVLTASQDCATARTIAQTTIKTAWRYYMHVGGCTGSVNSQTHGFGIVIFAWQ